MSTSHTAKQSVFRAQAAVEVLSYASFFLLAFVVTMAVFFQMQSLELSRAEHSFAQEISYEFADHIHTTFIAGPGFVQNVTIPPDLLGKPYKLSVSRKLSGSGSSVQPETGFVYLEWQGPSQNSSFSAPTITTAYSLIRYGDFITANPDTGFIEINPSGYGTGTPVVMMENINGTIRLSRG